MDYSHSNGFVRSPKADSFSDPRHGVQHGAGRRKVSAISRLFALVTRPKKKQTIDEILWASIFRR